MYPRGLLSGIFALFLLPAVLPARVPSALSEAAVPDTLSGQLHADRVSQIEDNVTDSLTETEKAMHGDPDRPPAGLRIAPAGTASNPLDSVSVGRVNGSWKAQLELAADTDEIWGTLNGRRIGHLFKRNQKGTQIAHLAPDDGLRFGRNVLKVAAISQGRIYPTQTVNFRVDRSRPLASAGSDQQVRMLQNVQLDGRRTLPLSAHFSSADTSTTDTIQWRIARAPSGSEASLLRPTSLQPSFKPDLNGTYEIELTVRNGRTGMVGRDQLTIQARPNYPQIGVGIETMSKQSDGSYAIVLGTNCSSEIMGCPPSEAPGMVQTFPYGSNPVQLLILDRETLEVKVNQTYGGSELDFLNAFDAVYKKYGNPILVILAALPGYGIDSSFQDLIEDLVSQPSAEGLRWLGNAGGWSMIGVPQPYSGPGTYGHLNPGTGPATAGELLGNMKGYLQFNDGFVPGSSTVRYNVYNFTLGDYVSFNTSVLSNLPLESPFNVMLIGGTSYPSESLGTCSGGFQLVVLHAATLTTPTQVLENQTFPTNCSNDGADQQQFDNLAVALANAATVQTTPTTIEGGAVVLLQSIGNPISTSTATQQVAVQEISPVIESLGGIADAFNKSMLQSQQSGNPGYALATSTYLQKDAPLNAQVQIIPVYAPEASGAATGVKVGDPIFLEGLLKRNYLWRYTPVAAAAANASPGFLPTVAYQPATDWPTGGATAQGQQNALIWFSDTFLQLTYTSDSVCYNPAYHNVRALYCAEDVKFNGGEGWSSIALALDQKVHKISFPISGCDCTSDEWQQVYDSLSQETANVAYVRAGIKNLRGLYGTSAGNGQVELQNVTNGILSDLNMSDSATEVAGFWTDLAANILGGVSYLLSESDPVAANAIGIVSTLAFLVEDMMNSGVGTSDLGQIIQTTAEQLPQELENRYVTASNLLGTYGEIILSDYGKLITLGSSPVFQTDWTNDSSVQGSLTAGAQRFAYGRLLGAVYDSYGLLPDSENPNYPTTPADYVCKTGWTDPTAVAPFGDAQSGAYIGLTRPNYVGSLPAYGGAPNLLVLGNHQGDWNYETPPNTVMNTVFASIDSGGAGEWPIWFFRHNFRQVGYVCSAK